jgi:uncharacterized repeat protein (TIGR03943 family)
MTPIRNQRSKLKNKLLPWLDVLAITAWGILMFKYRFTGKLNLLIHPDFFWLVMLGAIVLLTIAVFKGLKLWKQNRRYEAPTNQQHINIFPPGWSSALLLTTAILGFIITPRVFASQTALERGVSEILGATRAQPQAFQASMRPEDRTLIDWIRTLNVYPEPDDHTGKKVKVEGFVIHPPELDQDHLVLARFIITCCAADAYPVGLPVQLPDTRDNYPPDTWLQVEGQMITETIANKRQLTIKAKSLQEIPQPKNPYSY